MANKDLTSEKILARKLYRMGTTGPADIARMVSASSGQTVTRQTVGAWIAREGWAQELQDQTVTPLELANEVMLIIKSMLSDHKNLKAEGKDSNIQSVKEVLFWTRALRQLDEDYDLKGSMMTFSGKFIDFVGRLQLDTLPRKKEFVADLQKVMPLFFSYIEGAE
jgi:hypothetical protein